MAGFNSSYRKSKEAEACPLGKVYGIDNCPANCRSCCPTLHSNFEGNDEVQAVVCLQKDLQDLGRGQENYIQNGTPGVVLKV